MKYFASREDMNEAGMYARERKKRKKRITTESYQLGFLSIS
jgi:hypothetical protein